MADRSGRRPTAANPSESDAISCHTPAQQSVRPRDARRRGPARRGGAAAAGARAPEGSPPRGAGGGAAATSHRGGTGATCSSALARYCSSVTGSLSPPSSGATRRVALSASSHWVTASVLPEPEGAETTISGAVSRRSGLTSRRRRTASARHSGRQSLDAPSPGSRGRRDWRRQRATRPDCRKPRESEEPTASRAPQPRRLVPRPGAAYEPPSDRRRDSTPAAPSRVRGVQAGVGRRGGAAGRAARAVRAGAAGLLERAPGTRPLAAAHSPAPCLAPPAGRTGHRQAASAHTTLKPSSPTEATSPIAPPTPATSRAGCGAAAKIWRARPSPVVQAPGAGSQPRMRSWS